MRINKREKVFFVLIAIVILMGVGYAYLTTNLNILGSANLSKATWDVHFENVQVTSGSVTTVEQAPTIDASRIGITYEVTLNTPGDYYEFTVDVKNGGTIDAMIENVTSTINGVSPGELPIYLKYSATYSDGIEIQNNHMLNAGEKETYKIRLEYNSSINPEDLPETDGSYIISFKPDFIQKNSEAKPIPKPVSFAEDSWETIINAVKNGNTDNYNVGDTKDIDMGEFGTQTLRIANKSTLEECSSASFSQTACGFVLEFKNVIIKTKMNSISTNVGGWPASDLREYVNSTIYNSMPSNLKSGIINTKVVSGHGSTEGETNFTSTDKLYLLSFTELGLSSGATHDSSSDFTRKLDYYDGSPSMNIKQYNGSASRMWLRSAYASSDVYYCALNSGGSVSYEDHVYNSGVSPAFRIG